MEHYFRWNDVVAAIRVLKETYLKTLSGNTSKSINNCWKFKKYLSLTYQSSCNVIRIRGRVNDVKALRIVTAVWHTDQWKNRIRNERVKEGCQIVWPCPTYERLVID